MTKTRPQLGVCYYPEHWPEAQWEEDARQMVEQGLSWVRIGEFSWGRLEASPGVLSWEWLDKAINILGSAGLKIILGTPTATPPKWIVLKYPDMLPMTQDGATRKFGSRRHYSFSHKAYREECARIAGLMGERYGQNPHIKAWQIDNEYGCHDTILSYGVSAEAGFQLWLTAKYKTIAALNAAWGNVFWSMEYAAFADIELPNQTVTEPNPAHVMDFRRFASDEVVSFNKVQVEALQKWTNAPLIHNYMGRITEFDHFAVGKDLEIASWDSYPLGFLEDRSDKGEGFKHQFMRQGDPDFQAFHHDIYRAVGRSNWWVMEQQPGPVNWAPYNPNPLPGMVRLWSWEAIAHGAEVVSYFRWRQAPFAQEQMHSGLQLPNGFVSDFVPEIKRLADELDKIGELEVQQADVAIVFDYASAWAWDTQPQGKDFDYFRLVYEFYCGLRRLGLSVDILPPNTSDFGQRKLVLIPGLFAWNESLRTAVMSCSGEVLIGPRSGSKTDDFQIPKSLPPDIKGFSASIKAVETLRPTAPIELEAGGAFHIWREHLSTEHDIVEMGMDGDPAWIQDDNINYLAGWPDDVAMMRILSTIAKTSGLSTEKLPEGYRCRTIGEFTLHMNYGLEAIDLKAFGFPTSVKLGSADVALINNKTQERLI